MQRSPATSASPAWSSSEGPPSTGRGSTSRRPTLDWKREYVEDVPDTIMKNAIAKVFADCNKNKIALIE